MSLAMMELDHIPKLWPDENIGAAEVVDVFAVAEITGRTPDEVARRFAAGHRAYVAIWEGAPAAFGWVATSTATMGELGLTLTIAADERYLWNFVTLPAFRGKGVYPRLLQEIIAAEGARGARRFWIAYAPENHASGSGIRRAGFTHVAELSFDLAGQAAVRPLVQGLGPQVSALLGVPVTDAELTPCWKCVRAGRGTMYCAEGACECDYQRPAVECTEHAGGQAAPGMASSNGAGIS